MKHCECGCGAALSPVPYKGRLRRFVHGHHPRRPLLDRIMEKVEVAPNGCWLWTASGNGGGYGKVSHNGRCVYAHRVLYEHHVGPIPAGLELDHLCRTPACVNPQHLEPVTHLENCRRGAMTRLTSEDVKAIRKATGADAVVAERFGIHHAYVNQLRNGKRRVVA